MGLADWISLATMIVLAVTAVAILWYSYETRKMRNEMVKQTELSIRPQIVARLDEKGEYFYVKNVGHDAAFNILTNEYYLVGPLTVKLIFDRIDALMPREEKRLDYKVYTAGKKEIELRPIAEFNPEWHTLNFILKITYDNIEAIKYLTKIQCGKDGIKLLETKKLSK